MPSNMPSVKADQEGDGHKEGAKICHRLGNENARGVEEKGQDEDRGQEEDALTAGSQKAGDGLETQALI